jgi:TetR/AcrR family transcriptional regulator, transcriptional repressor for nem operon
MSATPNDTAGKLVAGAAALIVQSGYNGFSYADLAEQFGIRKPSIHHHFPSKVDLVVAVVEQARARIRLQIAALQDGSPIALDQLLGYTGYWARCIQDQTTPFCLAAILAAELPGLPTEVALAVRGHFVDLAEWLAKVMQLGVEQGSLQLDTTPAVEAERFMAAVYGAMLAARAFDDPQRFSSIVDAHLQRIRVPTRAAAKGRASRR